MIRPADARGRVRSGIDEGERGPRGGEQIRRPQVDRIGLQIDVRSPAAARGRCGTRRHRRPAAGTPSSEDPSTQAGLPKTFCKGRELWAFQLPMPTQDVPSGSARASRSARPSSAPRWHGGRPRRRRAVRRGGGDDDAQLARLERAGAGGGSPPARPTVPAPRSRSGRRRAGPSRVRLVLEPDHRSCRVARAHGADEAHHRAESVPCTARSGASAVRVRHRCGGGPLRRRPAG